MKCERTKLAAYYVDGELSAKERERFEGHLRCCRACSMELEALQRSDQLFHLAPRYQAPPGLSTRVMARLSEKQGPAFAWFPFCIRSGAGLALLAVMTAGILSGRFLAGAIPANNTVTAAAAFYLDTFAPAPRGSIGGAYLALAEGIHEK